MSHFPVQTIKARSIDRLGISGLGDDCDRIMPGRMYAVISELFDFTRILMQQVSSSHRRIVVVCHTPPQKLLQGDTDKQRQFSARVDDGTVILCHLQGIYNDSQRKSGLAAVRRLMLELTYYIKASNSLLVIENGSQMLGIEQTNRIGEYVALWQEFLGKNNNSLLLLLSDIDSNPLILNNLRTIEDQLAGLSTLSDAQGQTKLKVQHWYSPSGVTGEHQFNLSINEEGFLQAKQVVVSHKEHTQPIALDRDTVWTLTEVVKSHQYPQTWSVSPDFTHLDDASESAVSGTIILPYLQQTQLHEFARTVFTLRKSRGNQIKIIVREVSARMRHSEERLIRFLGATLVAPVEMGFSSLLGIIDSIKELEYDGDLSDDFEQAFVLANPDRKQGYLSPKVFVEHVNDLIIQTRSFGIKFAYVKLVIYRAMRVRDVLKICQIRRPGDICTADTKAVHLFLFGCRESDIAKALTFIFNVPVGQLFESEERNTTVDEALLALEALEYKIEADGLKDHSRWLSEQRNEQQCAPGATVIDYPQSADKRPVTGTIRRPLKVKS